MRLTVNGHRHKSTQGLSSKNVIQTPVDVFCRINLIRIFILVVGSTTCKHNVISSLLS